MPCFCSSRFRLGVLLVLIVPLQSLAGVDELPFESRLFLTVDRQSNYSSTLARQASIAVLDGASANPGAAAYPEPAKPTATVTASTVFAPGTGGRDVVAAPLSFRWQAPGVGTIALAYSYTDTLNPGGNDNVAHSLRSDEWIGGYGRRVAEHLAAGFTVRLTSGTIVSDAHPSALGGSPVRSETHFLAPDFSAGLAGEITPSVTAGIAGGYSRARANTMNTNLAPLPVTLTPGVIVTIPPGFLLDTSDDVVSVAALRGGLGWRNDDSTGVYFDVNWLHMTTHHSGSGNFIRYALGAEHEFNDHWRMQAGIGLDSLNNFNWSGGVGYRFAAFDAQLAFQSNAAPEVNAEIGRTRLVSASIAWRF